MDVVTGDAPKPWMRLEPRPSWRGWIHQVAAILTVPFIVAFALNADPGEARVGAVTFAVSLVALFATSAAYHRIDWSPRWLLRMKRADHVAIFALCAGTYTGVSLVIFDGWQQTLILTLSWAAVIGGAIAASFGAFEKRGAANASYITLGWLAVLLLPRLVDRLDATQLGLIVAGGVLYTVGAIALAMRRPDPWPRHFGYHEVWHCLTVVAAICHGTVVWSLTG